MVALSNEEKEQLKQLLVIFFGSEFEGGHIDPTESTLELTESFISEIYKCNKNIRTLFKGISEVVFFGKGYLRKVLKRVVSELLKTPHDKASWCHTVAVSRYKTPIYMSATGL